MSMANTYPLRRVSSDSFSRGKEEGTAAGPRRMASSPLISNLGRGPSSEQQKGKKGRSEVEGQSGVLYEPGSDNDDDIDDLVDANLPPYAKHKDTIDEDDAEFDSLANTAPPKRRYIDGKPRPFFRGRLHGTVTLVILVALPCLCLALLLEVVPAKWWAFAGFLAGKGASYGASALLHLYPFKSVDAATWALKLDLVGVTCSIWGTPAPVVLMNSSEWLVHLAIGVTLTIVNAAMVHYQFVGKK